MIQVEVVPEMPAQFHAQLASELGDMFPVEWAHPVGARKVEVRVDLVWLTATEDELRRRTVTVDSVLVR